MNDTILDNLYYWAHKGDGKTQAGSPVNYPGMVLVTKLIDKCFCEVYLIDKNQYADYPANIRDLYPVELNDDKKR